jgi:hypothetical protein
MYKHRYYCRARAETPAREFLFIVRVDAFKLHAVLQYQCSTRAYLYLSIQYTVITTVTCIHALNL